MEEEGLNFNMEIITGILLSLCGIVLVLFRQNQSLRSENKLNNLKIEDSKLEERQENIKKQKEVIEKNLQKLGEEKSEFLDDKQIVEYWNKDDK